MKRVVLVGEHPYSHTGNGNMMNAILNQIDFEKFQVTVCSGTKADIPPFETLPYTLIVNSPEEGEVATDNFGMKALARKLSIMDFDALLIVGIDIWRLADVIGYLAMLKKRKGFAWGGIIPYDLYMIRRDWLQWIRILDFPCVYSQYGQKMLAPFIPRVRYYRPPLNQHELFRKYSEEEKMRVKKELFQTIPDDGILMGFVGPNQFRKDPQRLLKAFFLAKKDIPNLYLYMHTKFTKGVFNLQQAAMDYGAQAGDIVLMNQRSVYSRDKMPDIYNSMDIYINPSLQEGLSWTVLEAMLCGVPSIVSNSTAHKELSQDGVACSVNCTDLAYIPMHTERGPSWIESRACSLPELVAAIKALAMNKQLRDQYSEKGLKFAQEWINGINDVNELLEEMCSEERVPKKSEVLFVQHSSAGDVLMSTQCFKGLKERHPDKPLVYMTQKVYQDIVEGNPYIDRIADFDEMTIQEYEIVYNPHGDRILPGGFNNLDTRLHYMYPYFTKVEPDEIFIEPVKPKIPLPKEEYIVVHTTGGSMEYRGYKHMDMAVKGLGYKIVQVGSSSDIACREADYDLRGKLTWRETAWVMKNAKAAVVIDSFPSHLAGALGTPVVVLYGPAPARVTGPRGDEARIINLEPNKLDVCPNLTNCWGNPGEKRCTTPCINTVSPMKVRKALKSLLEAQREEAFGI